MSPHKRVRPNPAEGSTSSASLPLPTNPNPTKLPSQASTASEPPAASSPIPSTASASTVQAVGSLAPSKSNENTKSSSQKQVHKARSWYGSWPRVPKSSASTQVARETILGGTLQPNKTPDFSRYDTKKSADSPGLSAGAGDGAATTSLPQIQEDERSLAQSPKDGVRPGKTGAAKQDPSANSNAGTTSGTVESTGTATSLGGRPSVDKDEGNPSIDDKLQSSTPLSELQLSKSGTETTQSPITASGWLGWFSKPPIAPNPEPAAAVTEPPASDSSNRGDGPAPEAEGETQPNFEPPKDQILQPAGTATTALPVRSDPPAQSWFAFWLSRTSVEQERSDDAAVGKDVEPAVAPASEGAKEQEDVMMQDAAASHKVVTSPQAQPAGSTWAFWSRDTVSKAKGIRVGDQEAGELAVIGEGSEARPQPASAEVKTAPQPPAPSLAQAQNVAQAPASGAKEPPSQQPPKKEVIKKSKRLRPQSMDIDESPMRPGTPKSDISSRVRPESPAKPGQPVPTNLVLPSFKSTYRMKENPSILRQIGQLLLRTQQPPANHVFLTREPPKIKKALAIGVHGLFPATYLRPMIGQPTGTSIKFANHCAEAIRKWTGSHGCADCEIEKVALEGEGKIADRVENLWKLLLNWIDHIRSADLIILACHSQGVPVGIMLVAKLIELGIITTPMIGVCAMAGVCLGPFPDYRSGMGMLMGSAAELWEFANPESEVSKRYEVALKTILDHGVRVTYIGSIDDQVVPIESAVYSPANHPYIYRAIFIDGRIHAPDFIAHLVGFALKLRNMGISDHGLVRELSVPLAGSLYSGEGHSRLYDDPQVYDLAVSHALEVTNVGKVPCEIRKHEGITNPNPYYLPWIMRGLLEEDFVKTELTSEATELLKQFDNWKPVTKALKDVKYRLEAVRSKL